VGAARDVAAGCTISPVQPHRCVGLLSIVIFLGKVLFFIFVFMWVRWTVPRFRYDQVMKLGWQKLLPLAIGNLIFYASLIAPSSKNAAGLAGLPRHPRRRRRGPGWCSSTRSKNRRLTPWPHTVERKPLTLAERTLPAADLRRACG
jgi:hypothetical protein